MFKGPIEDRLAIRELWESYADAVFRADAEEWSALWAEDGAWTLMGQTFTGRAMIRAVWEQAMSGFSVAAFFVQPGALIVDGATATGRSWTQEVLVTKPDGAVRRIVGAYEDAFVRKDGRWLFQSRRYTILVDQQGGAA